MGRHTDSNSKTIWLVAGSVFVFSLIALKQVLHEPQIDTAAVEDLNYEMPRPEAFVPPYDMSGKRVRVHITGQQVQNVSPELKVVTDRKPLAAQNKQNKKDDKKKKDAKKTAQKKQNDNLRAAVLQTRLVDTSLKSSFNQKVSEAIANVQMNDKNRYQAYNPTKTTNNDVKKEETNKLSDEQWHDLLISQPSQANAQAFVQALQAGELKSSATFYSVAGELLKEQNAEKQQVALYMLKQVVTADSFVVLVQNYRESTPETLRAQIYSAMKVYAQPAYFAELNKVIANKDSAVVQLGLQVLQVALSKSSTTSLTSREGRSGAMTQSPTLFKTFVPALQKLTSSENSTLAMNAETMLQQIQSLTTVATIE